MFCDYFLQNNDILFLTTSHTKFYKTETVEERVRENVSEITIFHMKCPFDTALQRIWVTVSPRSVVLA